MTSSSPAPKLPIWVFFATDVVLLGAAAYIATHSTRPLSETATLGIVACIIAGAIIGLVPLVIYYERQKNDTLDDRQRALEALARTVANSAEQISIAAGGLHEIAELAQKNLRHAEQLPHKLQEKIAEFQAQLANANEADREELEKELEELRSSESERLQATSEKIAKTTAEFAKLEAATQQHLTAANEAVSKLALGTAGAIGKAQAAAEQALSQARQEAARTIGDATGQAVKSIETAKAAAIADLAAQIDAGAGRLKAVIDELGATVQRLQTAAVKPVPVEAPPAAAVEATSPVVAPPPAEIAPSPSEPSLPHEPTTAPPKRPRKQRREEAAVHEPVSAPTAPPPVEPSPAAAEPESVVAPESVTPDLVVASEPVAPAASEAPIAPAEPTPVAEDIPATEPTPTAETVPTAEPTPVPAESMAEIAPVAPTTAQPFTEEAAPAPAAPQAVEPPAETPPDEPIEAPKPARKPRPPKKVEDDQPRLGLDLDEPKPNGDGESAGPGTIERVLTSDGATRLLVTAYIGIGNRLFIRGAGPGLSWDKGTPLQFVSIGKWRWETNDASGPVQLKLLKNDDQECSGLGTLTIDPGHQHEVTATFS